MSETTPTPLPTYYPPNGNLEDGTHKLEPLAHAREAQSPDPDRHNLEHDPVDLEDPPAPSCPTPSGALKHPPNGGPATKWNPDLECRIIAALETGSTLVAVCRQPGMPAHSTVTWWEHQSQSFRNRLDSARARGAEALVQQAQDELERLGQGGSVYGQQEVTRARDLGGHLRWRAERADPTRFGRHLTISGRIDHVHTSVREAAPDWMAALVDVTPQRPALEAPAAPDGEPDEDADGPFKP